MMQIIAEIKRVKAALREQYDSKLLVELYNLIDQLPDAPKEDDPKPVVENNG
jgi:hypothetical protein